MWQIDEDRDDGKPFHVQKRYTLSLHEKAGLRKDLESWRGKPFSDTELQGFDVENLLGVAAMLNIVHAVVQGSTFANIASIMRLAKGMQAPTVRDYVRVCDRPTEEAGGAPRGTGGRSPTTTYRSSTRRLNGSTKQGERCGAGRQAGPETRAAIGCGSGPHSAAGLSVS